MKTVLFACLVFCAPFTQGFFVGLHHPTGFVFGSQPQHGDSLYKAQPAPLLPSTFRIEVFYHHPGFFLGRLRPCTFISNETKINGLTSCAFFFKIKLSRTERLFSKIDIASHFHELLPKTGTAVGLLTLQNGIDTSLEKFKKDCASIRKYNTDGTLFLGVYLAEQGILGDLSLVYEEMIYKILALERLPYKQHETGAIKTTRQIFISISESLHNINPDAKWLHFAHSRAGIVGFDAILDMESEVKERLKRQLIWCGVGPASCMDQEWVLSATDAYSKEDFITRRYAPNRRNPEYNVRILPCLSRWSKRTFYLADHAFLGTTYQKFIKEQFREIREKYGFFNANSH